jgi:hypothetical protein
MAGPKTPRPQVSLCSISPKQKMAPRQLLFRAPEIGALILQLKRIPHQRRFAETISAPTGKVTDGIVAAQHVVEGAPLNPPSIAVERRVNAASVHRVDVAAAEGRVDFAIDVDELVFDPNTNLRPRCGAVKGLRGGPGRASSKNAKKPNQSLKHLLPPELFNPRAFMQPIWRRTRLHRRRHSIFTNSAVSEQALMVMPRT